MKECLLMVAVTDEVDGATGIYFYFLCVCVVQTRLEPLHLSRVQ